LADEFESEWKRELLEQAMRLVQRRVQPHTWEVFQLMTQTGLTGPEVAERLQMKVGAVWVAKSKVQKMIREELQSLETVD
jgi:RNA polymerase sigma-70 factor (ECF subfamily)